MAMSTKEMTVGAAMVKAWNFPASKEIDIEVWNDGNFIATISVNTETGEITNHGTWKDE